MLFKKTLSISIKTPAGPVDPLTELIREGARELIQKAVEAELGDLLDQYAYQRDEQGRAGVVRNGYQPEREILTGVGPVTVKVPKVRSRLADPVSFRSALVPPYVRRTKTVEAALPWLYLKGISSGQMQSALEVLVGPQAKGLSANVIRRLKRSWEQEYEQWRQQPLDQDRWVYLWADGIYSDLRAEEQKLCLLVIIGVNERDQKQLLAVEDGVRESTQSWREVLLNLKHRGLTEAPKLAVGDRSSLLAFYDFPAQHWAHVRTTNPIESTFATIRHRSDQTKGCVTRKTMLTMVFKLGQCAQQNWLRIRGFKHLAKVITGVVFKDGIELSKVQQDAA